MSQQQTVLRVQKINAFATTGITQYEFLDLYSSIPITINKSFAELGDIGKRNSDYSVGVLLPGSKKNNVFFESYFNVDAQSLFFNATVKVPCNVLINDEPYFTGYMRLNRVSVKDSKVEYDVTLYSTPAELYGAMGNLLLKDLNFDDVDYKFNHTFNLNNVTRAFSYTNFAVDGEEPLPYIYPVVHNGYEYFTGDTVNFTNGFIKDRTNLYTSTGPLDSYPSAASAWAAGVQQHRINSPTQGLYNNQLKPALNIYSLLKLMFKTYGYAIESDFFNTPWMKSLYMYGYFSSIETKFSYTVYSIQTLPLSGVEIFAVTAIEFDEPVVYVIPCKRGTGIPVFCDSDITFTLEFEYSTINGTIPYGTSGVTYQTYDDIFISVSSPQVPNGTTLKYLPVAVGESVTFVDNDYVDFSLVIDQNIKQIDILSSIAKKFNLILIPDPNNGNVIRIEPYDFYIGTGEIHNWSDKISYDKGFTVEPALNFIESELLLTDSEDSDEGNALFQSQNNRIYGQNNVYNPTSFKSQVKEINTIFSPELIRKWDSDGASNIGLPLGINYVASNTALPESTSEKVNWRYTGIKTKPKLMFWLGSFNPFLDLVGETYDSTYYYKTYMAYIQNSSGSTANQYDRLPVISHTMPMGNPDSNKSSLKGFENDSQCILFNSELPVNLNVLGYNAYTENDAYTTFYEGRVSNLYDPNTRVLSGYFNLSYSDIKNLQPQDLIKIQEQYFVVSKISDFNLTNRQLSKVELIQFNGQPNSYPTRYFKYFYCDRPNTTYKFKTDFTNPNLLDSNYGWSVLYDHEIGALGGSPASGYTSTFFDDNFRYVPYYIFEVTEDSYNASGIDWEFDSLHNFIYSEEFGPFQNNMPTFWTNSGNTVQGVNLFTNCATFETARTTYGILTGSSTYHGTITVPSPTPTATPTPTPAPGELNRGSILMTLDEVNVNPLGINNIEVSVNNASRKFIYNDINNLYSTYVYVGDVMTFSLVNLDLLPATTSNVSLNITRRDYTTDATGGNAGIIDTFITGVTSSSVTGSTIDIVITATTAPNSYNFEYLIESLITNIPTPTPTTSITPSITPTISLTPTITPTNSVTPTRTLTPTPSITPSITPSPDLSAPGQLDTSFFYTTGGTNIEIIKDINVFDNNDIGITLVQANAAELLYNDGSQKYEYQGFPSYITYNSIAKNELNGTYALGGYDSDTNLSGIYLTTGFTFDSQWFGVDSINKIRYTSTNDLVAVGTFGIYSTTYGYGNYSGASYINFVEQVDGKIIAGGASGIQRYNANMTLDTTFSGITSAVFAVGIQSDGKVIAVSNVSTTGYIKRYNTNGTLDTTFSGGTFTTLYLSGNDTMDLAVDNYNRIIVIGLFTMYNSTAARGIIRLYSDGTIDTTFNYGTGFNGGNGFIGTWEVEIDNSGNILVGGNFTSYNGISVKQLCRIKSGAAAPTPTPTPTNSVTPTITPSNTVTPSITPSNTKSPTPTPSVTRTVTPTATVTPSSVTPTPTPSITATITPTNTITPTMSLTPTMTVTPSPTPVPIRLSYRYTGQFGNSSTKTVSNRRIDWGGTAFTIGSNFNWTTGGGTGAVTVGTSYVFSDSLNVRRNICKTGAGSQTINDFTINIYVNSVLYKTFTNNTNTTITTCPSNISSSRNFSDCSFNGGDEVEIEWIDTMVF